MTPDAIIGGVKKKNPWKQASSQQETKGNAGPIAYTLFASIKHIRQNFVEAMRLCLLEFKKINATDGPPFGPNPVQKFNLKKCQEPSDDPSEVLFTHKLYNSVC